MWLAALFTLAWIEEPAILAAMDIRITMRAFIIPCDLADQFYLSTAIMTDHNTPCAMRKMLALTAMAQAVK